MPLFRPYRRIPTAFSRWLHSFHPTRGWCPYPPGKSDVCFVLECQLDISNHDDTKNHTTGDAHVEGKLFSEYCSGKIFLGHSSQEKPRPIFNVKRIIFFNKGRFNLLLKYLASGIHCIYLWTRCWECGNKEDIFHFSVNANNQLWGRWRGHVSGQQRDKSKQQLWGWRIQ